MTLVVFEDSERRLWWKPLDRATWLELVTLTQLGSPERH